MTATDSPRPTGTRSGPAPAATTPQQAGAPDDEVVEEGWRPARWPVAVGLVLCAAGLAIAGYLTYAHYTTAATLACPDTGLINCAKVTTSGYSHIFGFPVAVLGLVFFAAMVPLNLPVAWRSQWAPLRVVRVLATVVGVGMVLWLLYAELFKLDAICLYCTGVHILTVLLFFATVLGTVSTAAYTGEE